MKKSKKRLEKIVEELTDAKVTGSHSVINIWTGDRIIMFSIAENIENKF